MPPLTKIQPAPGPDARSRVGCSPSKSGAVWNLSPGGLTHLAAADRLNVSARTLRRRIDTVCRKFGVNTRIEATAEAARRGLI